jgi:Bifunctional DNA primase/polymerase, N-terminal
MTNLLAYQNARAFAENGVPVFPDGPLWGHGFQNHATADLQTLEMIHAIDPGANWRIRLGRESGLLVLDCPRRDDFWHVRKILGPLDGPTWKSGRPTGGLHRWFATDSNDADCELGKYLFGTKAVLKASAPIPGSIHKKGERYRWYDGFAPGEIEIGRLPERWLDLLPKVGGIEITLRPEFTAGGGGDVYDDSSF